VRFESGRVAHSRATPTSLTMQFRTSTLGTLAICMLHCVQPESRATPGNTDPGYDVIVVGSGAGGGPLAARMARAGKRVLLLEAGADVGDKPHYQVPAMHGLATEDPEMAWWFFVQHHADESLDQQDSKWTPEGILYPRGSALGGSTAVNAMVTVLPSRSDWNRMAELLADRSFRADAMAPYYARVRSWLSVEIPDPRLALGDAKLSAFLTAASMTGGDKADLTRTTSSLASLLGADINQALLSGETTGLYRLPLATRHGKRNGPREWILETVAGGYPLTVQTGSLVTRVVLDGKGADLHATGVEYVRGRALYGASLGTHGAAGAPERATVRAAGEVVLAAGTFNTPQLLMLSGIGDPGELNAQGIETRAALPAVGKNLQDRYEASVVNRFETPLAVVEHCRLGEASDPCIEDWKNDQGVYRTSGFLATLTARSQPAAALADLQIFAVPSESHGYVPGYSADAARSKNSLTWLLLKAHTQNSDGYVRLKSADPFARPQIHFRSYDERDPEHDPDLLALVSGVKTVRQMEARMQTLSPAAIPQEVWPGAEVRTDAQLAAFIRRESWGHHACGTSRMGGPGEPNAVVNSAFQVRGVAKLRVVDASVFPEIPGTFIALPLYMLAEKAADTMLGRNP
jgi:choline dehydrogenase